MPYNFSTKKRAGKKVFCMTSKASGKTYCYKSAIARTKGIKTHEMFKTMSKSKRRVL